MAGPDKENLFEHNQYIIDGYDRFMESLRELDAESKLTPQQISEEHEKFIAEKDSYIEKQKPDIPDWNLLDHFAISKLRFTIIADDLCSGYRTSLNSAGTSQSSECRY